jgi:hypothetical protein
MAWANAITCCSTIHVRRFDALRGKVLEKIADRESPIAGCKFHAAYADLHRALSDIQQLPVN